MGNPKKISCKYSF